MHLQISQALLATALCIMSFFGQLSADQQEHSFALVTIPKCGTGLINKFFELCSPKTKMGNSSWFYHYFPAGYETASFKVENILTPKIITELFNTAKRKNSYPFAHTNFARPFMEYINQHPEWKCVLQIRDLRDACISMVYWRNDLIENQIGKDADFNDKLMFVISAENSIFNDRVFNLRRAAERAVEIMHQPNVLVCRYEEMVGSKGGGSDQSQMKALRKIVRFLNIPITNEQLKVVAAGLWGNDEGPFKPQFRKGQIYKWRGVFTPEHKKAFKKYFGKLIIQLGYEENNNW